MKSWPDEFGQICQMHGREFYHGLLAKNYPTYQRRLFLRNQDKSGQWYMHTQEEILDILYKDRQNSMR